MTLEGYWTLTVICLMLVGLITNVLSTEFVMFLALAAVMLTGVISPEEALAGFSNPGLITIALLFIVSAAIRYTGALNRTVFDFLGTERKGGVPWLLAKMMIPVAFFSAFLNNTTIVTILTPIIKRWTEKMRLPASKFFIPLSYATVLGGACTLIGTSTNLVVHGLMLENGMSGLTLFELAWVGIPCTVVGLFYLVTIGEKLLPARKDVRTSVEENTREYVVEMKVKKGSELDGKTVKQAGLRNLRGLFLLDIERGGKSLGPISSNETILAEDRLMFVGIPSAVVELQEIPGLVPSAHEMFEKDFAFMRTHLVEAVISSSSPIVGKTVKESHFRARYGAGVVAVHRGGERIKSKIGDIKLRAGDTLLLFTRDDFIDNWRDSQDFYLVSYVKDKPPEGFHRSWVALGIVFLMVLLATLGETGNLGFRLVTGKPFTVLHAVFLAVILLVLTRSVPLREAKRSLQMDILITIACSLGLSKALQNSGVASLLASNIIGTAQVWGPFGVLVLIYLITNMLTEVMSNNAAAALVFPVALEAANILDVSPMPFLIALTVAASLGFSTPIGYQTHLIVQGAGGYKFGDYLKVGFLLNVLCFLVAILVIPRVWSF